MSDFNYDHRVCCIKECDKASSTLGLCVNHYRRNRLYGSPVAMKGHSGLFIGKTPDDRFEMMVIRKPGCWGWRGSTDRDGYAIFRGEFDGEIYRKAHRYSYARTTGVHPGPLQILHSCDNPTCVNPDHLSLGTNADNMADKIAKGRARVFRGEAAGRAVLTEVQAREVLSDPRSYQQIATDYGVTASAIGSIKNRDSWRHLDVEPIKGRHRGDARRGVSDKLTPDDVRAIRASAETGKALAAKYEISAQSICDIRKRRSWKHID